MSSILTTARLVFKSSEARTKAIEAFRKIIAFTTPNEPEVLQYVCALPVQDGLGTEIYMIEEYASQAASDAHLATKPVQDLIQLFTTGDVLAQAPEVHNCPIVTKKASGTPPTLSSNLAIVLVNTPCKNEARASVLGFWRDAVEEAFKNSEYLNVSIAAGDEETHSVRMEYVLASWDAFNEFAGKAKNQNDNVAQGTGPSETVELRPIDGFIGREEKSKL